MTQEIAAPGGGAGRFYTVTHSAGLGGANYTDDVMLVQFYLKRIYSDPMFYSPPEIGPMKVDGICGPVTRTWIRAFQLHMQQNDVPPSKIRADGRVDRARQPVEENRHYTMALLVRQHAKGYPEEDVRLSADAPPYLRKCLVANGVWTYGGGV